MSGGDDRGRRRSSGAEEGGISSLVDNLISVYGEKVIENYLRAENFGRIDVPDGYAKVTGPCGDTMECFLIVEDGVVTDAGFLTDGCITTIASGNAAINLIKGKSIQKAQSITQKDIVEALGGLPPEDEHCALLAANTVRMAVRDYMVGASHPWRKLYRKF